MAIDASTEQVVSLHVYRRIRPPGRNGRPMHISTAYRHALDGVRGVRLETVRIGGTLYTSREAIQRFLDRVSERASSPATERTASESSAAVDAARIYG